MGTNIKHIDYVDQPCGRCGSKCYISKTWKEKIPNYSGGFTEVECSQIKCSNKDCQKEFEKRQAEEEAKKESNRVKKEENDAARKANALLAANKTRSANRSRI